MKFSNTAQEKGDL